MNTPDVQVLPDSQALHAEQSGYAGFVSRLVWLGLAVIGLAFPAYVLGWLAPQWPLERLPTWWGLSAQQVAQLAPPSGWPGLDVFVRPDLLSLAGIAVLASAPALGLLGLIRQYLRRGDHVYVWICLALLALLFVAAVAVTRRAP